jgi:hypothetical protein
MLPLKLPHGRVWLRVAKPDWADPLDTSFAKKSGGRWNPRDSFDALYFNVDLATAQLQVERMCAGTPVTPEDLSDEAYTMVAATLPVIQQCADVVSDVGLTDLGLPTCYPLDHSGDFIPHSTCQAIGVTLRAALASGVLCRSACTEDGRGREFAWFPINGQTAASAWDTPIPYGDWRYAVGWSDIGLADQDEVA